MLHDPNLSSGVVVVSTYRNPQSDQSGRLAGLMGLFDQMMHQDYQGRLSMVIVDSSVDKHPFFEHCANIFPERFLYAHIPSRNAIPECYKKDFPEACRMIPNDDEVQKSPFWQFKARSMEAWQRFVPIEDDFPRPVFIAEHMFQDRPCIGMKKNFGVMASVEKFGKPDVILFADDDDYKSSSYVSDLMKGIQDVDFTRITKYLVNIENDKIDHSIWGEYNFPFEKDANNFYFVPDSLRTEFIKTSEVLDDGSRRVVDPKKWFARAFQLAWSPMSHEGATHTYKYDIWEKSLEAFGGCAPCSFGEDVIFFKSLEKEFGKDFKSQFTEVNDYNFLRTSDGTNASYLIYSHDMPIGFNPPEWAQDSINRFKELQQAQDKNAYIKKAAEHYKQHGCFLKPKSLS
jgi:hypothetical protein